MKNANLNDFKIHFRLLNLFIFINYLTFYPYYNIII